MKRYRIETKQFVGDLHTPVSLYLKVRDLYPQSAMLESSDYNSAENSKSFIALAPLASISITNGDVKFTENNKIVFRGDITDTFTPDIAINNFMAQYSVDGDYGVFGYTAYDSVKYFENIPIDPKEQSVNDAPDMLYILYKYLIEFDHFHNILTVKEIVEEGADSDIDTIISVLLNRNYSIFNFTPVGDITSTITDSQYIDMVEKGIKHALRGDLFQIVLSRRFEQKYVGDDFAVYRKLRSINPSPYLFYFDFGGFRIFGSSPETHCKIEGGVVTIDPIAGTAFRTGDSVEDARLAEELLKDPKENSEHVMLVDLARNDISRNATDTHVALYKEVQYYSHVIHLVSRVCGNLRPKNTSIKGFIDTFPAGTLSGAPKVRAMQLINDIEPHNRGIYGGAIGYIGFNGDINQAITIRTFVSRNNTLEFQAGAGIVALSNPERELQEVNNKLGALSKAITTIQNL